jgi:hypothetical protein
MTQNAAAADKSRLEPVYLHGGHRDLNPIIAVFKFIQHLPVCGKVIRDKQIAFDAGAIGWSTIPGKSAAAPQPRS